MDVVKKNIEKVGGAVYISSEIGEGTTTTFKIPLTLAIIQALMVEVGEEKYAIPLDSIQTIEDVKPSEIKFVENREVINLRDTVIPLVFMNKTLECESTRAPEDDMVVVIVRKGEQLAGLVIDTLIGQLEIVIKPLGKYMKRCKFISGATILGDGGIALILDANALV